YVRSAFFFSSRRRHTRSKRDWSSDVCSSDLLVGLEIHVLKDTPDAGAADRIGMQSIEQGGNDLIERPPRDRAILVLRQGAGHGEIGRASCRERVRILVGVGG